MFKLHFDRAIASIPKDANESLTNANSLMAELKALEDQTLNGFQQRSEPKGSKDGVADGTAKVQAEAHPEKDKTDMGRE